MRHSDPLFQGIKFFDPEIVGDTPEAVELNGVRNLLAAAREHVGLEAGKVIFAPGGEVRGQGQTKHTEVVP